MGCGGGGNEGRGQGCFFGGFTDERSEGCFAGRGAAGYGVVEEGGVRLFGGGAARDPEFEAVGRGGGVGVGRHVDAVSLVVVSFVRLGSRFFGNAWRCWRDSIYIAICVLYVRILPSMYKGIYNIEDTEKGYLEMK